MSVQVMTQVWKSSLPTAEKMVLLVIADHAADDGSNAWPGIATIARKASMSERTVQRHLRTLEEQGLIAVESQAGGTKTTRNDRRPNRYDINLRALHGVTNRADDEQHGVTTETPRGDKQSSTGCQMEHHGVTTVSPYPSLEPSIDPSLEPSLTLISDMTSESIEVALVEIIPDDDFSHFWAMYPRRTQKSNAVKRWANMPRKDRFAALKALSVQIERWRVQRTEQQYIPHPATWLYQRRWEDEIVVEKPENLSRAARTIQEMMKDANDRRPEDRGLPRRAVSGLD